MRSSMTSVTRWCVVTIVLALLSACDSDGRGCFGLCDQADDDDPNTPTPPTIDRSCYPDGTHLPEQELVYAETDPAPEQVLSFEQLNGTSTTNLRPLLVWVTGDTWQTFNDPDNAPAIALSIARELGAHFAVVRYRDQAATEWPEPIRDVNTAIRFLKTRAAEFDIDTDRIFIGGDQAGAHLAALAATDSNISDFMGDDHLAENDQLHGLIALGGVYDFDTIIADSDAITTRCGTMPSIAIEPVKTLFDCPDATPGTDALSECDANVLDQASPIFHISSDDPPAFIWHGEIDCDVPDAQSQQLEQGFSANSFPAVLNLLDNNTDALEDLTADAVEQEIAQVVTCADP